MASVLGKYKKGALPQPAEVKLMSLELEEWSRAG